jgi:phosphoglycolate phosphatase/AHBA synthesis associated protein
VTGAAPEAVLFDLDGVLIDSYRVWFALLNATARDLGYSEISPTVFHECWGQGSRRDRDRFFPNHELEAVEAYYREHFLDHVTALEIAPGVPELFGALRARGLGSAVITNTPRALAVTLVRRAQASPDAVVGGDEVALAKPAPDMVWLACELLGVEAQRALVVGDSAHDREAARAAGARFAGLGIEGDVTLSTLGELLEHL